MEKLAHLASSSNPIELDQMIMALEQNGITHECRGKQALEIGSVDLMGMSGAGLYVAHDKLDEAKRVLVGSGLFKEKDLKGEKDHFMRNALIGLGLILILLLIAGIVRQ